MEIRPISDLRNRYTDITNIVNKDNTEVILTKNGKPEMVVVSYDYYNKRKWENEVYTKLMEAEITNRSTDIRYTHDEVFDNIKSMIRDRGGNI